MEHNKARRRTPPNLACLGDHVTRSVAEAAQSKEPDPVGMPRDDLHAYLGSHPTVSLWPFTGKALGASRSLTYQLAQDGTIQVLRLGHRCRVASAWLEKTLFGGE